jgi:protein-glutamine gamma-glutamyltransferase
VAVKWARWIDHLPLWIALGATISTGIYEPGELALMAAPLIAAGVVVAFRWDVGRFHRWMEIGALVFFLGDLARGQGLFTVAIHTLFVLAGVRLVLPKEPPHRRQLLLMGFLLFLTTAIGTTDVLFLVWTLAWACAATLALLQQSWEPSAALSRGTLTRPPFGRVPVWVGAAALFGAGFFIIMPRLSLGLRPGLFPGIGRSFGQAGLGERLDLSGGGPIEPNPEVAVRIAPPAGIDPPTNPQWIRGLELLRGVTLEKIHGPRWEPVNLTPSTAFAPAWHAGLRQAEFLYTPSLHGILGLPAGLTRLDPPELQIVGGPGASLRWRFLRARPVPVTVTWDPEHSGLRELRLSPHRLDLLTQLEPEHEAARRASFRFAPGMLPTPQLVKTLESALQAFRYTLDNPSGQAANPLADFLERSQAGHCEYFASALALMLRARSVPTRVVNGYRLGPWIPEGGYFRVSQNEAHSWVEYWHEGQWWTSDPTPHGLASVASETPGLRAYERWLDAIRYRWDRHVVRFSDQDQQAGLSWIQVQFQGWDWRWKAPSKTVAWTLAFILLSWMLWRSRQWWPAPAGPGRIRALRPLLATTRRTAPVEPGDTARAWLLRLAALRPERIEALQRLAHEVDSQAYGLKDTSAFALAKAEAIVWRDWKPLPPTSERTSRRPS